MGCVTLGLVEGQELCHRLSLWEQSGMLQCQAELGLGMASVAAMVPCKRKTQPLYMPWVAESSPGLVTSCGEQEG